MAVLAVHGNRREAHWAAWRLTGPGLEPGPEGEPEGGEGEGGGGLVLRLPRGRRTPAHAAEAARAALRERGVELPAAAGVDGEDGAGGEEVLALPEGYELTPGVYTLSAGLSTSVVA
ncbi:hypothetical protein GPECTOR_37g161 [Gonium pectorale]|uniref:Uncharacterized protein n=1 Tax=Gonium pectorale TaxID=33097 RepID=A0A150GC71_GONPE|nr:hypothetical protein GPECTOR_37g161 [Gonium pectorale]|eukprot:KXZ47155.1 hypothetical protein GPECTOR_37g161 [Gonium pectorale]